MRASRLISVLSLLVIGLVAGRVRAVEPNVVLGPTAVAGFSDADGELAREALAEALRMQGMRVTPLAPSAGDGVGSRAGRGCDLACGTRLLATAGADLSAWVKLSKLAAAVGGSAQVTLLDAAGHRYEGVADVRSNDVREATTRAVLEARSYQLLGPGPWLRVVGTPEGAQVLIDGDQVGTVPYRAPVAAGQHGLTIREAGYVRSQQTLNVPDDDSRKLEIKVALEPTSSQPRASAEVAEPELPTDLTRAPDDAVAPDTRSGGDQLWLAGPITLGVLGVALATVVTVRIATGTSQCEGQDDFGNCTERRTINAGPTVGGYVLSAALIGSAVTWLVLGSQKSAEHASKPAGSLRASLGLGHIAMTGSF